MRHKEFLGVAIPTCGAAAFLLSVGGPNQAAGSRSPEPLVHIAAAQATVAPTPRPQTRWTCSQAKAAAALERLHDAPAAILAGNATMRVSGARWISSETRFTNVSFESRFGKIRAEFEEGRVNQACACGCYPTNGPADHTFAVEPTASEIMPLFTAMQRATPHSLTNGAVQVDGYLSGLVTIESSALENRISLEWSRTLGAWVMHANSCTMFVNIPSLMTHFAKATHQSSNWMAEQIGEAAPPTVAPAHS